MFALRSRSYQRLLPCLGHHRRLVRPTLQQHEIRRQYQSRHHKDHGMEPPTGRQLMVHAVHMGVPMVGFGFMDNIVMLQMGELIDSTIGVTFGLSTLTAAGFGQIFSDVAGVSFGGVVDAACARLGLPTSGMTTQQLRSKKARLFGTLGAGMGVVLGCLLGMSCLFFMDLDKADRMKKAKELATLFNVLLRDGHTLLSAEMCSLYMLDKDGTLYSKASFHTPPTPKALKRAFSAFDINKTGYINEDELRLAFNKLDIRYTEDMLHSIMAKCDQNGDGKLKFSEFKQLNKLLVSEELRFKIRPGGFKDYVVTTGNILNVGDVASHPRYESRRANFRSNRAYNLLIAPVRDVKTQQVIGVIEVINKTDPQVSDTGLSKPLVEDEAMKENKDTAATSPQLVPFDENDEKLVQMMAKHAALFISHHGGTH